MRKTMLLLACLLFSATEVTAQWQKVLLQSGREMIYSTTEKVVAETGTHAAAKAVLTSPTQALIPIMQLAPVLAFDAYVTSLPRVDLSPALQMTGLTTAPKIVGTSPSFETAQPTLNTAKMFQTYSPAGFVGMTEIPSMTALSNQGLQQNVKRSLWQRVQDYRQKRMEQRQQLKEQELSAAKQDLPKLVTRQTTTVTAAELLEKLPDVQHVDPPTMSILMDQSRLAEAIEVSNPNIPLLPFLKEPGFAYRGMAVTPADITRFFQPGVGIERRLTEASNRLNMSMAAGSRGATVYFATHKVLNVTPVPQHAQMWGAKFLSPQKPILIVVRVKGNYGKGNIINYDHDILPKDIDGIAALLEQDGHPRWFDIRAAKGGMFQITPYEIIYK